MNPRIEKMAEAIIVEQVRNLTSPEPLGRTIQAGSPVNVASVALQALTNDDLKAELEARGDDLFHTLRLIEKIADDLDDGTNEDGTNWISQRGYEQATTIWELAAVAVGTWDGGVHEYPHIIKEAKESLYRRTDKEEK